MQSHYSPMGPASTSWSETVSDSSSQAVQLGHPRSTFQGGLPLYNGGKNIESWGSAPPVANCSGFGTPMYCQGFHTPINGLPHYPQAPLIHELPGLSNPHSLPQHEQFSTGSSLFPSGAISLHEAASRLPPLLSSTSTLVPASMQYSKINSLFATTPSFPQLISPLTRPASCHPSIIASSLPATVAHTQGSLFAAEPSLNLLPNRSLLNSHPASVSGHNISSLPPLGYINAPGASVPENSTFICSGSSNESATSFPVQTISQYMPSSSSFFSSIQGETSLPSVSPGQVPHPSYSMLSSSLQVQPIHEDARFKAQEPKIEFESESVPLTYEWPPSAISMQEPLLPLSKHPSHSMLPSSLAVQTIHEDAFKPQEPKIKPQSEPLSHELPSSLSLPTLTQRMYSEPVIRFTEDFDFVAMNKKFNKAEVWGHLGKGKALAEYDKRGKSSDANAIREEDEKSLKLETQISGAFSRRSKKKGGSDSGRHGSNYDKGNSSNTKGRRRGFPD